MLRPMCLPATSIRKNRQRILAAALELVANDETAGLTMECVALRAGVTRRTTYNHYANIADLCLSACAPLLDYCASVLPASDNRPGSTRNRLRMLALDIIAFQRDPVVVQMTQIATARSRSIPTLLKTLRSRVLSPLERIVAARVQSLHPMTNAHAHATQVIETASMIAQLDYLVTDLHRSGPSSIVIDMLIEEIGGERLCFEQDHAQPERIDLAVLEIAAPAVANLRISG